MTPGIEIVFSNGIDCLSLFYKIYDWPSAKKWYKMIQSAIDNNIYMWSDTSFVITKESEQEIILKINLLIKQINENYNLFIQQINSESDLNTLHYEVASASDCLLWSKINDAIHAYEQYKSNSHSVEPRINAYFQFIEDTYIPLEHNDYFFFKADREYGDLCMNYTYKGKHWLELAADNDIDALHNGQLQPENRIKAGGYMIFRPPSPTPFFRLSKFIDWHDNNLETSITPEMAIGYLLLGKLIMPDGWSDTIVNKRAEWTRFLSDYKKIIMVKVIDIDETKIEKYLKLSKMID